MPPDDLGPLERVVLEQVWKGAGDVTVREVSAGLPRPLAYTTVMTTLDRLYRKGLLSRRKDGRAFRYAARSTPEQFATGLLRRWLGRLAGGGPVRPLLASLVDAVSEHDAALLPELERLVRAKERAARGRKR
ncbi:MAG TPA: BlaI/MecI/CopY family transcriptional regulator [Vicinamibacteria bacterium]|jgi:predicted transcriptional regulator